MKFIIAFFLVALAAAIANASLPADFPVSIPVNDNNLLQTLAFESKTLLEKFGKMLSGPGEPLTELPISSIVEAARKSNAGGNYGYAARFHVARPNPKTKAYCTITVTSNAPLPPTDKDSYTTEMGISCEESTEG